MIDSTYRLPVLDTVKQAWLRVHGSKLVFFLAFVLLVFLGLMGAVFQGLFKETQGIDMLIMLLLVIIVLKILYFMLIMSAIYMGVERAKDRPIRFGMMRYGFNFLRFINLIGCYILMMLPLFIAFVFLFIPSVFWGGSVNNSTIVILAASILYILSIVISVFFIFWIFRVILAPIMVVVENINPWQAVKRSYALTKSNIFRLIGLGILKVLLILLGVVSLGIGFIWIWPLLEIINGVMYLRFVTRT